MPRYQITIEYDGTPFVGWQQQQSGASVQGAIAAAVTGFSGESVRISGAGRTDSGVHALGQVAHFDLTRTWDAGRIREALNHHLRPDPVAIIACSQVSDTFDARFSATARQYRYRILARRPRPALDHNRVWWVSRALDAEAMIAAAPLLEGHHDFTTFRTAFCQAKSPMKTLDRFRVSQVGEEIHIEASARSFLHSQVRSMVGSLELVGAGKWQPHDLHDALKAADRTACGPVAPAAGLYLVRVEYPEA